jgi:hypothetical protein
MSKPALLPILSLALLLGGAGFLYTFVMGHDDPVRLAVAALTGVVVALCTAPLLARLGE